MDLQRIFLLSNNNSLPSRKYFAGEKLIPHCTPFKPVLPKKSMPPSLDESKVRFRATLLPEHIITPLIGYYVNDI
jgi:hypothetical protein